MTRTAALTQTIPRAQATRAAAPAGRALPGGDPPPPLVFSCSDHSNEAGAYLLPAFGGTRIARGLSSAWARPRRQWRRRSGLLTARSDGNDLPRGDDQAVRTEPHLDRLLLVVARLDEQLRDGSSMCFWMARAAVARPCSGRRRSGESSHSTAASSTSTDAPLGASVAFTSSRRSRQILVSSTLPRG